MTGLIGRAITALVGDRDDDIDAIRVPEHQDYPPQPIPLAGRELPALST